MFEQISILVKIYKSEFSKNFDCFENFEKFRFWSNFRKISILVKISNQFGFLENFEKKSILVKIFEKFRFQSNFLKNFDFGQNFRKISIIKFSKKFRFWSNFRKNFDFGQNFRKKLDFSKIFEKISIVVKNFVKFRF